MDLVIWRTFIIRKVLFERSHLELWKIIGMTYIWCRSTGSSLGLSYEDIKREWNIGSQHSAVYLIQFTTNWSIIIQLQLYTMVRTDQVVVLIVRSSFITKMILWKNCWPQKGYSTEHQFNQPTW